MPGYWAGLGVLNDGSGGLDLWDGGGCFMGLGAFDVFWDSKVRLF